MNSIELFRRLHQHRMWANSRLLETSSKLSWEQLQRPLTIGQGSVWKTLVHLQAAEYVWLETLLGDTCPLFPGDEVGKLPGNQLREGAVADFNELENRWQELDQRWQAYLVDLAENSLDEQVHKVNSRTGQSFGTSRADVLLHVCTHAQYTTAQSINMLRQLGVKSLPDVMLITLARSESDQT
ncbi:DinB family protein [Polystyrenella longa]|uniref:DinB family protein n=1 Tax=Polystyrenella longa TaxID=2528007 RepID=A0A518CSU8_9PLAN|nr:DinB family protein [Polystyrenella longa]QDU82254.1 DinB family protein [Polystyrenella longa]